MSDAPKNYYELLGLRRTATVEEIKAAYAAILKEVRAGIAAGKSDAARLTQARAAFGTLSDAQQREAYDRSLAPPAPLLMPPIAEAKAPSESAPEKRRNFFVRAWRKEVPAWKIFWFMVAPWLLLGFLPLWVLGVIAALIALLLPLPVAAIVGVILAVLLIAGAVLLWRCAFNLTWRPLGYLARVSAALVALMPVIGIGGLYQQVKRDVPSQATQPTTDEKGRELFVAAQQGNADKVRSLIAAGADVKAGDSLRSDKGRTALHWAAGGSHYNKGGKHLEVAKLLLAKGADVNAKAEGGYAPLHVASGLGQVEMVRLLLDSGADINAPDRRATPLEAAILQGHEPVVALLIERKANLSGAFKPFRDISNYYPSHTPILRRLLDAGAEVNEVDKDGSLPIDYLWRWEDAVLVLLTRGADVGRGPKDKAERVGHMVERRHKKVLEYLFAKGHDPRMRTRSGQSLMHFAAWSGGDEMLQFIHAKGVAVDTRDAKGSEPIHAAASRGNTDAVKWLLKMKVAVDAAGEDGKTALMLVSSHRGLKDDITKLLLQSGASLAIRDHKGHSALDHAAMTSGEVVRRMLNAGARVDATDKEGNAALHRALPSDAFEALVDAGANVNVRSQSGRTPLHQAATRDADAVKLLLVKGADPKAADAEGVTPLHVAVRHSVESVDMLINAGASSDARDKAGRTPMHFAATNPSSSTRLVKAGADINAVDRAGNTPLHEAARTKQDHLIKHLIAQGAKPEIRNRDGMTPMQAAAAVAQEDSRKAFEVQAGNAGRAPK